MDCQDYITESVERKKGQHLQREERGAIQHLKNAGYTNRAIARAIGCSPTTVGNELKRGTPPRKSSKGRKPGYSARRGEAVYKANRKRSRKPHRICHCTRFIRWIMEQVKEHKWSLDACVGYARLHKLFSAEEMVCTHTLYNEVWAGSLDLSVTELPEAMKRKQHKDSKPREHKKNFGTDISQRPEIAALRIEEGHWEGDTVVGKRGSKEAVVLSLLEKKTENYMLRYNIVDGIGPVLQLAEGWTANLPDEVHDTIDVRTDRTWPTTWFAPRLTGEGVFKDVYSVMANWGANHGVTVYGHVGADLITLASMLRIPVTMHNVPQEKVYRPHAWAGFGTQDTQAADYAACKFYGPLYR